MKIYSQLIDLSKTTPQTFYVPPHSKFKLGVKLVQDIEFSVKLDGVALASDGEIDGFKTYSLESTNPGNTTYVVEAANGQKVKILQTTTNSTVFDVDVEGGGGVSEEYVDGKVQEEATSREAADEAIEQKIPTKTSQLSNDSGFLTEHQSLSDYYTKQETDGKVQEEATARATADEALRASIGEKADLSAIPTKTSQLANDSGFLTKSGTIDNALSANTATTATTADSANSVPWSGVQDKPTSLTGYGITDAATKSELDSLAAVVGEANTQLEEIA